MPNPIPTDQYPLLASLINETYADQVERILSAQLQDDGVTIIGVAQDGVKQIGFKIDGSQIQFQILNPDAIPGDIGQPDNAPAFAETAPEEPDTVDRWVEELRNQVGPIVDDWVGKLQDLLGESNDLTAFSEKLLEVYPELDGATFRGIMADAMTAASIAGAKELPDG